MTAFAKGNSQYLKYEYKVSILSFVYSILIQSRVQQNSKLEFQMRAHITRKVKTAVCNIIRTSYFRKRGNMKFITHLQKVQRAKGCPRHQKLSYIKTVIVGPKYLVIHTFAPFLHTCSSSSTHIHNMYGIATSIYPPNISFVYSYIPKQRTVQSRQETLIHLWLIER